MEYFAVLLPSVATLLIKIKGSTESTQFEFKSQDGTFIMLADQSQIKL